MRAAFAALAVLPALALGTWIIRGMLGPSQLNRLTAAPLHRNSYNPDHWARLQRLLVSMVRLLVEKKPFRA